MAGRSLETSLVDNEMRLSLRDHRNVAFSDKKEFSCVFGCYNWRVLLLASGGWGLGTLLCSHSAWGSVTQRGSLPQVLATLLSFSQVGLWDSGLVLGVTNI